MNRILLKRIFIGVVSLGSLAAQAQTIKVIKSTGQKAIVEFPKGTVPKLGQTYDIGGGGSSDGEGGGGGMGGRANYIGITNTVPMTLGEGSVFVFATSFQYGWNMGSFEFAPSLGFGLASVTVGAETATEFSFNIAVQGDFNFTENKVGEFFVPAFTFGGGFEKGGTISFNGGLAAKIYPFRQSQSALRLAVKFEGTKVPGTEGVEGSGGLLKSLQLLEAGIQTYF